MALDREKGSEMEQELGAKSLLPDEVERKAEKTPFLSRVERAGRHGGIEEVRTQEAQ